MRLAFVLLVAFAPALAAQTDRGLPSHFPLNPTATSRSPLYAQPYRDFSPRGWRVATTMEYGSAVEYEMRGASEYLLDAELLRLELAASRDLSPNAFIELRAGVTGSYDGFADGFFEWYHDIIGFKMPEREARPLNTFAYRLRLPGDLTVERSSSDLALGDTRVTLGWRHGFTLQSALTVTLPTATGNGLQGRGTIGIGTVHTVRLAPFQRLIYEGTVGVGVTPRHGELGRFQRTAFASGSTGIRLRLWGGQSVYGYFFYHTPYYRNTSLPSLDRHELTADFGWIARSRGGREWRVGLSEDLGPGDQGIDLVLKAGMTW